MTTPREARLERRLCEREREIVLLEKRLHWHVEGWWLCENASPGIHRVVYDLRRCKRAAERAA